MALPIAVASGFVLALLLPLVRRLFGRWAYLAFAALPAGLALSFASLAPGVIDGEPVRWTSEWVPQLNLAWSFSLDGLSLLFSLLITGIGGQVELAEGEGDDLVGSMMREFQEETGFGVEGTFIPLGKLKQPSGKIIHAWALEHDLDVSRIHSNTFSLEWPRHSGTVREYPEIDEGRWFSLGEARQKITAGQAGFLDRLLDHLQ